MHASYPRAITHRRRPLRPVVAALAAFAVSLAPGAGAQEQLAAADAHEASATPADADITAVYERFKALEGTWEAESTKGWTAATSYRPIAGESVVMSTSFDAHPDETMVTMIYLDADRLRLTHYCVSGTQPELVATRVENDGRKVTFGWTGGGNLPTRDTGHMDSVVYEFAGPDAFTSRWTWHQDGESQWFEQVEYQRER